MKFERSAAYDSTVSFGPDGKPLPPDEHEDVQQDETQEAWPQLPGYTIHSLLGRGGMGEVFLAFDKALGRNVALKRVRADRLSQPDVVERFSVEAHITAMLQHPAIMPVYRMQEMEGQIFYTMRPIEGQSLGDLLDQLAEGKSEVVAEWTVPRLVRVFLQVASAVAFAHSRGVIHRDLKPSNIMIGPFDEVLLLDWGMAKIRGGAASSSSSAPHDSVRTKATSTTPVSSAFGSGIIGTPGYMCPEQIRGESVAEVADVYSLGVILYEILALRLPWKGRNLDVLLEAMKIPPTLPEKVQPARDIPPALSRVAMRAIHFDPAARYLTTDIFLRAVSNALEGRANWSPVTVEKGALEWTVSEGRAEKSAQALRLMPNPGEAGFVAYHRYGFSGNVRVEFDMTLAKGRQSFSILLCGQEARQADTREGYLLGVSSVDRRLISVLRNGRDVAGSRQPHFETDRSYHVVAERSDDRISLTIDGEEVYAYIDPIPLLGNRIAFVGRGPGVRLGKVLVQTQGASTEVSCLRVPDTLYSRRLYDLALLEYRRIFHSLQGWKEGRIAGFRAGHCLVEMARAESDPLESEDLLDDAEQAFIHLGETVATPLAALGRSIVESERGRVEDEASAIEEAFSSFRHDPQLDMVREWLLSRLHALTPHDRRALVCLLPLALRYGMHSWGRKAILEQTELLRSVWEVPWFLAGRDKTAILTPSAQAEVCLWLGFWSGNLRVMENAVRDLIDNGRLHAYHLMDLVACLIELAQVTTAHSWLDYFETHSKHLQSEGDEDVRRLCRMCVLAAEGEIWESRRQYDFLSEKKATRHLNYARYRLMCAAYDRGRPEMAFEIMTPLSSHDSFSREMRIWLHFLERQSAEAEALLQPVVEHETYKTGHNRTNFLYGALQVALGNEEKAEKVFASLPEKEHPRTWLVGSYAAAGRLGQGDLDKYCAEAFPWERRQLFRQLALLERVRGNELEYRRYSELEQGGCREPHEAFDASDGPPDVPLIVF